MSSQIRVLIIDDRPHVRQSLKALLETVPQVESVLEAGNGRDAIPLVTQGRVDVVIMDVRMSGWDGLRAIRLIRSIAPSIQIVVLTLYTEFREVALDAGANVFLTKGEPGGELINAILS